MQNILVTGGSGFIGFNFINYLLSNREDVSIVNLDKLTYAGNPEGLRDIKDPWRYVFIPGDICSLKILDVLERYSIDTIVNFAAETHIDKSIENPYEFVATNIFGTFNLLECARRYGKLERFHHISTDEVFGTLTGFSDIPFSETTCYAPNTPYASSKASADMLVRSYWHTYKFPATISNCSNNYGKYQFPEKLIPLTIYNAVSGNDILLHGGGHHIRDWIYVDDHNEAVLSILEHGECGETYNIGGNAPHTTLEVINNILELLGNGTKGKLIDVKDRAGNDLCYMMDTTKISVNLNWYPKHSFSEGLLLTVNWYLNNWHWLENAISRPEHTKWIQKTGYFNEKLEK